MSAEKRLGIWMDHENAHLIEFSIDGFEKKTISSKFSHKIKEETLSKNENLMHNKEQHQQSGYYKALGEEIIHYDNVIIFGPTNAKAELHNSLKSNHLFDKIKIETLSADKMTDKEQHTFVSNYFSKQL